MIWEISAEWERLEAGIHLQPGVDFLIETVLSAPQPPVLVAIGPLTNVATAFRREPSLARRLRSLVVMGGRLGEHAALGEHNFNSDAEATRLVVESGCPLLVGTHEVTRQVRLGKAEREALSASDNPACIAAAAILDQYLMERRRQATSMYDPATLTLGYTDEFITLRRGHFTLAQSEHHTHLSFDTQAVPNGAASVAIRIEAFIAHMLEVITRG